MLRQNGDVYGYYMARSARGDSYANTALKVAMNEGFLGWAANFGLRGTAMLNGVDYVEYDVNIALMDAHGRAVNSDQRGFPGLLHHEQITAYHHKVFGDMGLPSSTFGGTPFTGTRWESGEWSNIWCWGCDSK
jgi:hypothetical protein